MSPRAADNATDIGIGKRLKTLRELKGIKQETLCDVLKISQQQLSKYERGTGKLPASMLVALFDALDTTPNIFFEYYFDEDSTTGFLDNATIATAKRIKAVSPQMRNTINGLLNTVIAQKKPKRPKS